MVIRSVKDKGNDERYFPAIVIGGTCSFVTFMLWISFLYETAISIANPYMYAISRLIP